MGFIYNQVVCSCPQFGGEIPGGCVRKCCDAECPIGCTVAKCVPGGIPCSPFQGGPDQIICNCASGAALQICSVCQNTYKADALCASYCAAERSILVQTHCSPGSCPTLI